MGDWFHASSGGGVEDLAFVMHIGHSTFGDLIGSRLIGRGLGGEV